MNTKFSTYAYPYILSEVIAFINSNRNIKLGREYQKLYKKIKEAKDLLTQRLMKEPSTYELSLFLELDENIIIDVLELTSKFRDLDEIISKDGKNLTLLDTIGNKDKDNIVDNLILREEFGRLSDDEKQLIWMRYWLDRTQQEVADVLGTNQVSVSRCEKKVLQRLKNNLSKVG
jgi:RNA polymerase sporulation-specific sigma factor